MSNVTLNRTLDATQSQVWAVLADFPNIADWNSGIKKSYSTNDSIDGVGAMRHCDLAPLGSLKETVVGWTPEEQMVISIGSAAKLPIKSGQMTFTLARAGGVDGLHDELRLHSEWPAIQGPGSENSSRTAP